MRTTELFPGVRSSVLGFGCAPILGSVGSAKAQRALDCALDCGITHFDLARSYGYGEAEAFVGRALRSRRDQVTIASKFGIRANWKAHLLRPAKPLLRLLKGLKSVAPTKEVPRAGHRADLASRLHDRLPMRGFAMRQSLERSLRAIGTSHLDILFVHEPREALEYLGELSEMAATLKREGKIRAWGLAFSWEDGHLFRPAFGHFDLLQFNNSPGSTHYEQIRAERAAQPNIFFSPFRHPSETMSPLEKLGRLYTDFTKSVVLCSMFREEHIRANARIAGQ